VESLENKENKENQKNMKISNKAKPGLCPATRCQEPTDGGLCARHASMQDAEQLSAATLTPATNEPPRNEQLEIIQEKTEAEQFLTALASVEVTTNEQVELANGLLVDVKASIKRLEARRVSATGPMNKALKEVNGWFKPVIGVYQEAETLLKSKISAAIRASQAVQDAALAEVSITTVPGGEILAVAHGRDVVETPSNISIRHVWKFTIENAAIVPRGFCSPDPELIRAHVSTYGQERPIPGVKVIQDEVITARALPPPSQTNYATAITGDE
jgi:hypothetical protein